MERIDRRNVDDVHVFVLGQRRISLHRLLHAEERGELAGLVKGPVRAKVVLVVIIV